ncbi:AMP-dependent synthetase/ligase [Rhodothermus profundi]|uniref:Long-chain acyl-CoA synthetase n=1 Tax=Rhodothermus profundi TaxID=633813 RepID=A0A1M6VAY8_9BACT|nr:long-chain fatty acid--CoA ligase [Rhodothermus profundi]SHK78677.1 long-chain acyl-CoA synthetase [Rhodothermus profundi]
MAERIYTAPPATGIPVRGKTLPDVLYEALARYKNPAFLNQPVGPGRWEPISLHDFAEQAEALALGLHAVGLERGAHVAFYMESDAHFCLADMACLIGGLVDVPIYLTHAPEAIHYVIEHAEARALVVSNQELLGRMIPLLHDLPGVQAVVVADASGVKRDRVVGRPLYTFTQLIAEGRRRRAADPEAIARLRAQIQPGDLATIIYTSGTTGRPKGVMLSHENISFNALTAFSGIKNYRSGPDGEVALSFLPLTHVFARTLFYGYLYHATSVYFTTPDALREALQQVRPTAFATVPRALEKIYGALVERAATMPGMKGQIFRWALELARRYELGRKPRGLYRLQLAVADRLVYRKWREAMGGRIAFIIAGGAALSAELANIFGAAQIPILQGYGLTETSPVITYNRLELNRAGTVGVPIPGVEVKIAEDGEILTRGPHVMQGYYKDPERTREVIDEEGWFHTGDIGYFTEEGFLVITDRKKDLFKLSTGKYVMPQPLEQRLTADPLIDQALVVGPGYKFTAALIFPDEDALRRLAARLGLNANQPLETLVREPKILEAYQQIVDHANEGMDPWATIKRFLLVPEQLSIAGGTLTPTLKVRRSVLYKRYEAQIRALYEGTTTETETHAAKTFES